MGPSPDAGILTLKHKSKKDEEDGSHPEPSTPEEKVHQRTAGGAAKAGRGGAEQQPPHKRGRKGGILVKLLVAGLTVGCVQILYFHRGIDAIHPEVGAIHWFDHDPWKVEKAAALVSVLQQEREKQQEVGVFGSQNITSAGGSPAKKSAPAAPVGDVQKVSSGDSNNAVPAADARNPILAVLEEAGLSSSDLDSGATLPSWEVLTELYGPLKEPIAVGMDTCERYRKQVPENRRVAAVAGMFNTGTNAMTFHLQKNVNIKTSWQVPWGKHRMEFVRLNHTANGLDRFDRFDVMPVILIRDPYHWMQSMCKSPYAAHWRGRRDHCPNLVPDQLDREHFHIDDLNHTFKVRVDFDKEQVFHWPSLAHLWNDYYRRYLHATDYPRLIFRFEDMLIHGPKMMKMIANCTGTSVPDQFSHQTKSAKGHGSGTTFIKAIFKTGDAEARVKQMTADDISYANQHLDKELMQVFKYSLPSAR